MAGMLLAECECVEAMIEIKKNKKIRKSLVQLNH